MASVQATGSRPSIISPKHFAIGRREASERLGGELHVLPLPVEVDGDRRGVARSGTATTTETAAATATIAGTLTKSAEATARKLARHASLKASIRLPNLATRIRKWRGQAGLDPYCRWGGRLTGCTLCLRDYFDRVDCRVLGLGRENHAKLSIGHFHRHSFNISASETAGLHPDVEVLEFMPLDIEGENTLAWAGNTLEVLREVELCEILAIRNLAGESSHSPMLAREQARILGSGDRRG
jgi:hypothetical protein